MKEPRFAAYGSIYTREQQLVQMSEALEKKDWGLTTAEIAWCMNYVRVAVESYSSENHDQYAGRDVRSCN